MLIKIIFVLSFYGVFINALVKEFPVEDKCQCQHDLILCRNASKTKEQWKGCFVLHFRCLVSVMLDQCQCNNNYKKCLRKSKRRVEEETCLNHYIYCLGKACPNSTKCNEEYFLCHLKAKTNIDLEGRCALKWEVCSPSCKKKDRMRITIAGMKKRRSRESRGKMLELESIGVDE